MSIFVQKWATRVFEELFLFQKFHRIQISEPNLGLKSYIYTLIFRLLIFFKPFWHGLNVKNLNGHHWPKNTKFRERIVQKITRNFRFLMALNHSYPCEQSAAAFGQMPSRRHTWTVEYVCACGNTTHHTCGFLFRSSCI